MKKKLYKSNELKELKSIIINVKHKNKKTFATKLLREFVEKYPNNIFGKIEYAQLLYQEEKYEDVVYYLEQIYPIKDLLEQNQQELLISNLAYSYFFLNRLTDCLKIIENNLNKIINKKYLKYINIIYDVVKYKLGILKIDDINLDNISYSARQYIDYNEELAIKHTKRHCCKTNSSSSLSMFSKNINISDLFSKIQKDLPNAKYIYKNGISVVYQYYYPNVGYFNKTYLDYLEVIALEETKKIITMYPLEEKPTIINTISSDCTSNLLVKKSMIDKFNQRYKKSDL